MKITHEGIGRPIVNHTLRPFRICLDKGDEEVAADESGYAVYFTNLSGYTFFIHRHRKLDQEGYALSESTTGRRISWAPNSNDVLNLAIDRLNQFMSTKGRAQFDAIVAKQTKVTEIKQGYDGTNDKSKPEPYETAGIKHPKAANVPERGNSNPERKGSARPQIRLGCPVRIPTHNRNRTTAAAR